MPQRRSLEKQLTVARAAWGQTASLGRLDSGHGIKVWSHGGPWQVREEAVGGLHWALVLPPLTVQIWTEHLLSFIHSPTMLSAFGAVGRAHS